MVTVSSEVWQRSERPDIDGLGDADPAAEAEPVVLPGVVTGDGKPPEGVELLGAGDVLSAPGALVAVVPVQPVRAAIRRHPAQSVRTFLTVGPDPSSGWVATPTA